MCGCIITLGTCLEDRTCFYFLALWKIGISLVAAQREFKVLSAQTDGVKDAAQTH